MWLATMKRSNSNTLGLKAQRTLSKIRFYRAIKIRTSKKNSLADSKNENQIASVALKGFDVIRKISLLLAQ